MERLFYISELAMPLAKVTFSEKRINFIYLHQVSMKMKKNISNVIKIKTQIDIKKGRRFKISSLLIHICTIWAGDRTMGYYSLLLSGYSHEPYILVTFAYIRHTYIPTYEYILSWYERLPMPTASQRWIFQSEKLYKNCRYFFSGEILCFAFIWAKKHNIKKIGWKDGWFLFKF